MATVTARATDFSRRAVRSLAARTGREERWAEIEGALDPGMGRNRADDAATRLLLSTHLADGATLIDVGANVGDILAQAVRVSPSGRHVAYEPIPALAADLATRFPGVDVRQAACSTQAGEATFTVVTDAPALSGLRKRQDLPASAQRTEEITVRLERLDDAIDPELPVAFVKVDVEGAEVLVLQGAAELLARHRPVVVLEHGIGGADLYGSRSEELWDLLDGAGLRLFDLQGAGPFGRGEFAELFASPAVWNYVAVPAAG